MENVYGGMYFKECQRAAGTVPSTWVKDSVDVTKRFTSTEEAMYYSKRVLAKHQVRSNMKVSMHFI